MRSRPRSARCPGAIRGGRTPPRASWRPPRRPPARNPPSPLGDRFRQRLREELGASYAPSAGFANVIGFPHLSHFVVYAELEPSRAAAAMEILERETKALAAGGPTADEFARAKQPYVREMTD